MAGESKLQSRCRVTAEAFGVVTRKVNTDGERGWPDLELIFPVNGETVFVEMKNPNKKGGLSKLQHRAHRRIKLQGAHVYVCDSYDEFMGILKYHLRKIQ